MEKKTWPHHYSIFSIPGMTSISLINLLQLSILSTVHLQELVVGILLGEFSVIYRAHKFITAFTTAYLWIRRSQTNLFHYHSHQYYLPTPTSFKRTHFFSLPSQNFESTCVLPMRATCPRLPLPLNVWWIVKLLKFLIDRIFLHCLPSKVSSDYCGLFSDWAL